MFSKIVLCAFPNRLSAGLWRMGRLVSCQVFANDERGLNEFRGFLQRHPHVPAFLIADVVEEDYRIETLPHTTGNGRRALLERKLGQIYRNTSYRAAQPVGREQSARRDDIFLLVALNNPENVYPWILAMEEQHTPLAGVYLLPMVSQFLLNRLKLSDPNLLLVDRQVSGLRQTFFQNGQLRVSRLVPDGAAPEASLAQQHLAETEKTRLYLLSQRLIAPNTKLSLLILTSDGAGEELCRTVGQRLGVECLSLAYDKLAGHIGLGAQALREAPELLYMQLVAKGQVPVNLAPAGQTRNYLIHRLRRGIGVATVATLFGGVTVSALNFMDTLEFRAQFDSARQQTVQFEQRYSEVARDFPVTPMAGGDLKIAVEMHQTLVRNNRTPQRLMAVTSAALEATPEIQLQRLRWRYTDDLNVKDEVVVNGQRSAPSAAAGGAAGVLREIGFVDGEISHFSGDYRAAMDSVQRLADHLRKDARVESVLVVQQPVNVNAYANLQGSTFDAQNRQAPAATFKLKVVLKAVTP